MKFLVTVAALAALAWAAISVLVYLFQERMVFLSGVPGRELTATPADIGLEYEDVWLDTVDGVRLHGWFVESTGTSRGALLFLHGNAGNISHRLDSLAIFNRLRLDVLMIDYRGYGRSEGRTTEEGTYADARAAWDHLVTGRGFEPSRIVVFGRSLGGAVAAQLASGVRPAGLIIESCFSSGLDMARRIYPFLPARLITRLDYPVATHAALVRSPTLVAHSRDDEIIPFEMGQRIHAAIPASKTFLEMRGDHNNGFLVSGAPYVEALDAFVGGLLDGHD